MSIDPLEWAAKFGATAGKSPAECLAEIAADDEARRKVKSMANKRTLEKPKAFKCERFTMGDWTVLTMPFPPSVNHYYELVIRRSKKTGKRIPQKVIGERGQKYRAKIIRDFQGSKPLLGRLAMSIAVFPPDHLRRDLGNLDKCAVDALQHAGIFLDDEQIDDLQFRRMPVTPPDGFLVVKIKEISKVQEGLF